MSDILEAFDRAAERASYAITSNLKQQALSYGWNSPVVSKMQVVYTADQTFDVEFADDIREQAMNLEYGTEVIRPTAALRKYDNSGDAEDTLAYFLESEFKKLL